KLRDQPFDGDAEEQLLVRHDRPARVVDHQEEVDLVGARQRPERELVVAAHEVAAARDRQERGEEEAAHQKRPRRPSPEGATLGTTCASSSNAQATITPTKAAPLKAKQAVEACASARP